MRLFFPRPLFFSGVIVSRECDRIQRDMSLPLPSVNLETFLQQGEDTSLSA
jgi:hypothetical protein